MATQPFTSVSSTYWQLISSPVASSLTISSLTAGSWEIALASSTPDPSLVGHQLGPADYWQMGPSTENVYVRAKTVPHNLVVTAE